MIHMLQFLGFTDCNPMTDSIHCILNAWLTDNNTDILMVAVCVNKASQMSQSGYLWYLVFAAWKELNKTRALDSYRGSAN